jgi:hypothetical protein
MRAGACVALCVAAVVAGCGAGRHGPAPARSSSPSPSRHTRVGQAQCLGGPAAPRVGANTPGVFGAGPLRMVLYRDPAQVSVAEVRQGEGGLAAYVTVTGPRPATLSVDPASQRRLGLAFTPMSGYGPGLSAVRFPPCPRAHVIGGTLSVHAAGCARLLVSSAANRPQPILVPVGNSLAGCPAVSGQLPSASFPYLGIRCHIANWAGCDRIGVGVHLPRPAVLVTVQVDGHLVTLSPPRDPGSDLWEGLLLGMGPRHGPLAVRARHGYWDGEPAVRPRVRVTAYFADGTAAARAGIGYLHAGYG